VTNSTFSDNGSYSGRGGGIFNPGRLTLRNTIVANSIFGGNCSFGSSLVDDGGNLDTDGTCVGTISPDPLLGPLQNNGGPTQTLAIPMAKSGIRRRKCRQLPRDRPAWRPPASIPLLRHRRV